MNWTVLPIKGHSGLINPQQYIHQALGAKPKADDAYADGDRQCQYYGYSLFRGYRQLVLPTAEADMLHRKDRVDIKTMTHFSVMRVSDHPLVALRLLPI